MPTRQDIDILIAAMEHRLNTLKAYKKYLLVEFTPLPVTEDSVYTLTASPHWAWDRYHYRVALPLPSPFFIAA